MPPWPLRALRSIFPLSSPGTLPNGGGLRSCVATIITHCKSVLAHLLQRVIRDLEKQSVCRAAEGKRSVIRLDVAERLFGYFEGCLCQGRHDSGSISHSDVG